MVTQKIYISHFYEFSIFTSSTSSLLDSYMPWYLSSMNEYCSVGGSGCRRNLSAASHLDLPTHECLCFIFSSYVKDRQIFSLLKVHHKNVQSIRFIHIINNCFNLLKHLIRKSNTLFGTEYVGKRYFIQERVQQSDPAFPLPHATQWDFCCS